MSKRRIPVVLLQVKGGVIHEMDATDPVRVIVLDADTEGGDEDNVHRINGSQRYVHDALLDVEDVNPDYVLDLAYQVEKATGGAPEPDEVENATARWNDVCEQQGWNDASKLSVIEEFLRSRLLFEELVLFAEQKAERENALARN